MVVPMREDTVGNTRIELLVLMGAAGCVLLIACANLAGLLLARGLGRRREMAVRSALGASRARLVTQMIAEGALIALAGGVIGVLLAPAGMKVLATLVPTALPATAAPAVDARVLGLCAAALRADRRGVQHRARLAGIARHDERCAEAGRPRRHRRRGRRHARCAGDPGGSRRTGADGGRRTDAADGGAAARHRYRLSARPSADLAHHPAAHQVPGPGEANRVLSSRASGSARAARRGERRDTRPILPFRSQGNTQGYRIEGRERVPGDAGDALLRVSSGDYLQTLGVRPVEGRLLQAQRHGSIRTGGGHQRDPGAPLLPEGKRAGPPHGLVGRACRSGAPSSAWCTTSTSAATNSP